MLGLTNMITAPAIQVQAEKAADAARQRAVLPTAVTFAAMTAPEGMKDAYAGW